MPKYIEVRGNVIEFPDDMSTADIEAAIKRNALSVKPRQSQEPSYDPAAGMSGTEKFLAGAGKAMTDIGRGIGQRVGLVSREDVDASTRRDAPLMRTGAGLAGNFVGNVAATAPLALIPGGASIAGGAAIGAGAGFLQPVGTDESVLKNVGIGGAAGGALPMLMRGAQAAKSFVDPLYQGGRDAIVGRALRSAAGNQADDAIRAMENAGQRVPGSMPTVGDAAGNPGLAALQRTATAINPVAGNEMALRQAANNEARIAALRAMTPDKEAAIVARTAATEPLYRAADGARITINDDLARILDRPSFTGHHGGALGRASALAKEEGGRLGITKATPAQPSALVGANGAPAGTVPAQQGEMTGRAAHYLKMALDDAANQSPTSGIGKNELRSITKTLNEFLGEVEKQAPQYGQARSTFREMSKPVTQADVLGLIAERSINKSNGTLTPAAFARALSDKTAKSATGRANATLEGTLEPSQLSTLTAILDDLKAVRFAQDAGRGVGSDTVQKLAYTNMLDQAGVPSMLRNFGPAGVVGGLLQRGGQIAYKDANERLAEQLARSMLSPELAAELMKGATRGKGLLAIENAIKRGGAVGLPGLLSTYAEQQ